MKFKKAFSLAEVLIAVVIIGIIATLTVPNSMKSMDRRHKITAYGIAFKGVATSADTIRNYEDNLCEKGTDGKWEQEKCIHRIFRALNKDVNPEGYICGSGSEDLYASKNIYKLSDITYKTSWSSKGNSLNTTVGEGNSPCNKTGNSSPWIITKSGIIYSFYTNPTVQNTCGNVMEINSAKSDDDAWKKACGVVVIDYNGLHKGPNTYPQNSGNFYKRAINDNEFEDILDSSDRFFIYVGNDGITAGSPTATVSGRLKNQGAK